MPQLISIGQIIDQSWEHYRTKLRELLMASVWLLIPGLLSIISISLQPAIILDANQAVTNWNWVGITIGNLNNMIVAPVIGLWTFILLVKVIANQREKKTETFSALSKTSWRLFFPTVLINFWVSLIFILTWLLILPGVALNFLGLYLNVFPLVIIAAFLLVAGIIAAGILTFCWIFDFIFAPFLLITNNEHGKKALVKSRQLITGRFWSTFLRVIVPKAAFLVIFLIIEILLNFIISRIAVAVSGLNIELLIKLESISLLSLIALGSIFVTPILTLVDYILFKSLQESKK